jgi:amino acid transporter
MAKNQERTPLLAINSGDDDSIGLEDTRAHGSQHAKTKNQLGTINGCYVPCCLNIMGAVMFMRLGWATGEAGMIQALSMLGIATLVTMLTGLSLSAIATNGDMGGGGSYFMISRSLGPEFGGAIGLCFYLAYTVSVVCL